MSVNIDIQLSPESQAVLRQMHDLPRVTMQGIAAAMDKENLFTVSHIQAKYLSGSKLKKPSFPGLRTMTGNYNSSLRSSKAVVYGDTVITKIGTNVKSKGFSYPSLHEFGGEWTTKPQEVRHRTDAKGNILRRDNGLLIFAKKSHKRSITRTFGGGKSVTIPARSPIQRGIKDRRQDYSDAISAAILSIGGKS